MQLTSTHAVALALSLASTASAHATMYGVWVNGVDQGDGRNVYIRSPPNNNPVKDLTSADLVCNVNGATAVKSFVSAAAGDTLTFEWYHDSRSDDIIASSHKGPIITYIAPYTTGDGTGAIWTKIAEEGYDSSSKLWAVDNLITAKGKKDFTLPSDLAAGQYLIRQEIIALHESDAAYNVNSARGAQFYPSCVQVEVTGSGSATPSENFDFNTGYTYSDPGILFNLYGSFTSYTIPGPDVWTGGSSGSSSGATTSAKASATASATKAASTAKASSAAGSKTSAAGAGNAAATSAGSKATTLATSVRATSGAASASKTKAAAAATSTAASNCRRKRRVVVEA